jgi:predicted nucleotidyltransferase
MKETIRKRVKKYGNSGGVYLPARWVGGEVEVRLIAGPMLPENKIVAALDENMRHVVSAFIYGSYARGEQEEGSDVDAVVVSDSHAKIKVQNMPGYDITVMDECEFRKAAENDILFAKSLEDAKPIINGQFLESFRHMKLPRGPAIKRIELASSSLSVVKKLYSSGADYNTLVYPLVMRLKEMVLLECAIENRWYSSKHFMGILYGKLTLADSKAALDSYRRIRSGRKPVKVSRKVVECLMGLLEGKIGDVSKKEKVKERH